MRQLCRCGKTGYDMAMEFAHTASPSLEDIAALGRAALDSLPQEFRQNIADIVLQVVDFASEEICRELGAGSPFDILGLYSGVDLTGKSLSDPSPGIDMIYLYRRPILDYWCEGDEALRDIVTHVLVHEIGHHFGLSDAAMQALEDAASQQDGAL